MSEALWGFLGVAVGAIVTFSTTWWQLNRAKDSEDKAHKRERKRLRRAAEATALVALREGLAEWVDRVREVVSRAPGADDLPAALRISYLAGSVRDDAARKAVGELLDIGAALVAHVEGGDSKDDISAASDELIQRYFDVQKQLSSRWRKLT